MSPDEIVAQRTETSNYYVGLLAPPERRAMAAITESADVLNLEDESWLLVPAPAWLLDTLAVFGAESEDREPSFEDEAETDAGIEDNWELDCP